MILHVCNLDKFIPPFIDLVNNEFNQNDHYFLLYGDHKRFPFNEYSNVDHTPFFYAFRRNWFAGFNNIRSFLTLAKKCDKIIIHGLFNDNMVKLLSVFPSLLKKCYWVIWGGDLYRAKFRKKSLIGNFQEFFRRIVIKRIRNFVTYVKGDYELAQRWYDAKGELHKCLMYTSNIFNDLTPQSKLIAQNAPINILVGNSAAPSNNHIEILEKLLPYKDSNIKIYAPLSYGNQAHARMVIKQGESFFGERFCPLTDFMSPDSYQAFLSSIDIAIFNHKRQQAMGNIINLLGMGKKVYIRDDITTWEFFANKRITLFRTNGDKFNLKLLNAEDRDKNFKIIKNYFSKDNLLKQLNSIFRGLN